MSYFTRSSLQFLSKQDFFSLFSAVKITYSLNATWIQCRASLSISASRWALAWRKLERSEAACCSTGRTSPPRYSVNTRRHTKRQPGLVSSKGLRFAPHRVTIKENLLNHFSPCAHEKKNTSGLFVYRQVLTTPVEPLSSTSQGLFFSPKGTLVKMLKWCELCVYCVTLSIATRQIRMLSINLYAEAMSHNSRRHTHAHANTIQPQAWSIYLTTVSLWGVENNVVSVGAILNGVWACSWQEANTVGVLWCCWFYHLNLSTDRSGYRLCCLPDEKPQRL